MRSLVIFPIGVFCVMAGLFFVTRDDDLSRNRNAWDSLNDSVFIDADRSTELQGTRTGNETSIELILDIQSYEDREYGFSMAIPAGWRKIVAANVVAGKEVQADAVADLHDGSSSVTGNDTAWVEPGYAVGFESAQQHDDDRFADYILVEILPGEASGLFAADVSRRNSIVIDGRSAGYDRLEIKQADTGLTDVDLVIYQAELSGVGYTVGLYAIGEYSRERIMAVAFEVMVQTFRVDRPPFSVS